MRLFIGMLFLSHVLALDKDWWKHSSMYEIYTPSFKDSNGDGWGDLKGITSKLDYLKNLGVDTLYLTPFHPSPMLDTGYDVSNYLGVNPRFGTMADFDELMSQMKKRNMKFILDLVINHSSDQHDWFKKSVNRIDPYTDYYVWRDPKGYYNESTPIEPNNWCSIRLLGTSAWTWNEKRKQFYYHAFIPEQPDLNYRNPRVLNEMKKIIKFWMKKGVAGIRLDATPYIFEDASFEDEDPYDEAKRGKKLSCLELRDTKTTNVEDTFNLVYKIRKFVDKLSASIKGNELERILILEAYGTNEVIMKYYGNKSILGCHYTFNTDLDIQFDYLNSNALNAIINKWMEVTPNSSALNWMLGCHDRFRSSFKFIQEYVNIMFTLISTLPGVMVLYYGEDIGMTSGVIRPHQRDNYFSAYARTPMQWDGSSNGGFSTNSKTWLPVNPNYWRVNVKDQQSDTKSVNTFIKGILNLRKKDVIKYGDFVKYILPDWVYILKRSFGGHIYIVVLNLGTEEETIYLDSHLPIPPATLIVQLSTPNAGFKTGRLVITKKKRSFVMKPMSAVILSHENSSYRIDDQNIGIHDEEDT